MENKIKATYYGKILVLLGLLFFCSFITQGSYSVAQDTDDEFILQNPELYKLLNSDNWFEDLTNPVLTSEEDIQKRQQSYEEILTYMSHLEEKYALPKELEIIKELVRYFIIFAGTYENSVFQEDFGESKLKKLFEQLGRCELVNLEISTDPAIFKLREEVGLQPPKGVVFLRYFPNKDLMPKAIQGAFENEDAKAVTFMCRYIAILEETTATTAEEQMKQRNIPKIVSHELVHAYINSILGLFNSSRLPRWFHEGCAIYFSGSGGTEVVSVLGPEGYIYEARASDPKEYKEYKIVFNYLENKIGRENFHKLIRDAIEGCNVSEIFTSAGAFSFEELRNKALAWHSNKENIKYCGFTLIVIGIIYLIYKMLPKQEEGYKEPDHWRNWPSYKNH